MEGGKHMLKKILKKKEEPKTKIEVTKEDIDSLAESMIQKNLEYNAKMQDMRLKQGEKELGEKKKRNQKAEKIVNKYIK